MSSVSHRYRYRYVIGISSGSHRYMCLSGSSSVSHHIISASVSVSHLCLIGIPSASISLRPRSRHRCLCRYLICISFDLFGIVMSWVAHRYLNVSRYQYDRYQISVVVPIISDIGLYIHIYIHSLKSLISLSSCRPLMG